MFTMGYTHLEGLCMLTDDNQHKLTTKHTGSCGVLVCIVTRETNINTDYLVTCSGTKQTTAASQPRQRNHIPLTQCIHRLFYPETQDK